MALHLRNSLASYGELKAASTILSIVSLFIYNFTFPTNTAWLSLLCKNKSPPACSPRISVSRPILIKTFPQLVRLMTRDHHQGSVYPQTQNYRNSEQSVAQRFTETAISDKRLKLSKDWHIQLFIKKLTDKTPVLPSRKKSKSLDKNRYYSERDIGQYAA